MLQVKIGKGKKAITLKAKEDSTLEDVTAWAERHFTVSGNYVAVLIDGKVYIEHEV